MRRFALKVAILSGALVGAVSPAAAVAVLYEFGSAQGSFSVQTDGFITSSQVFSVSSLSSCTATPGTCSSATINAQAGTVIFLTSLPNTVVQIGTFNFGTALSGQNFGTFLEMARKASLTISQVPETSSWAMMLTGFVMVGATLRHRRSAIHFRRFIEANG